MVEINEIHLEYHMQNYKFYYGLGGWTFLQNSLLSLNQEECRFVYDTLRHLNKSFPEGKMEVQKVGNHQH